MRVIMAVLAAGAVLGAAAVQAQDVLKDQGCVKCHDVDKKKVGPSLKDIAAKNKGNKDAQATLVNKLKEGKGHPKIAGSDADLNQAVKAVLETK
jgi:cytochrome c